MRRSKRPAAWKRPSRRSICEKAVASDYDTLASAIMERYGRLDGLVHNASLLGMLAPIDHYDVPTWYRVMHVNVTAAFALTHVLLPLLRRSDDASVIFYVQRRGAQSARVLGCVCGVEVRG